MGTFTKQIYRYTHKRNMRHNENLWPFVKILRNEQGEIINFSYKGQDIQLTSLTDLHHRYQGEVLVSATGPSVKNIDFSKLPSSVTIAGVNGAWHLHEKLDFSLYFVVDMTFIDRQMALLGQVISCENITLFTTVMGVVKLINKFTYEKIKCRIAIIEDICYETYKPSIKRNEIGHILKNNPNIIFSASHPDIAFSCDIRNGVVDAGTVVYWALQTLFFMGFSKIYIVGLDMNNFSQPRFYEKSENMLPSFLGDKVHDMVIPAMGLASRIFSENDIHVLNLSPQSAIPSSVFTRKDFSDVFK